jgi:hypothetical protein
MEARPRGWLIAVVAIALLVTFATRAIAGDLKLTVVIYNHAMLKRGCVATMASGGW